MTPSRLRSVASALLLLALLARPASAAGILESLLSWEGAESLLREAASKSTRPVLQQQPQPSLQEDAGKAPTSVLPQGRCLCQPESCLCCVDLNATTTIDLGGPACLRVQPQPRGAHSPHGLALNLSYADNPVHNATIAFDEATSKASCMNLLSDLAQICSRFITMKPTGTSQNPAYDGCLVLEPTMLQVAQDTYHMGCFNFNNNLVRLIENPSIELQSGQSAEGAQEAEDATDEDTLNAEELIAAVSASAEQGIALFSQWLGLHLNLKPNPPARPQPSPAQGPAEHQSGVQESRIEQTAEQPAQAPPAPTNLSSSSTAGRRSRNLNLVPADSEVKSEERFKQLLSAQDKVVKESATISRLGDDRTTYLYSDLTKTDVNSNISTNRAPTISLSQSNLAVVPRESRRGGRAYDIHRHINEV